MKFFSFDSDLFSWRIGLLTVYLFTNKVTMAGGRRRKVRCEKCEEYEEKIRKLEGLEERLKEKDDRVRELEEKSTTAKVG